MSGAIERSISLYRQTSGPLRCLSERDPCNHKGALRSTPRKRPVRSQSKGRK